MTRPTYDSIYLAEVIDERWETHSLTPAGIQKLVTIYGAAPVEDKLRALYGFPPAEGGVRSPYAYLEAMLRGDA